MKPVNVCSSTHIDYRKESNDKNPKIKVDDWVRISKFKNIYVKSCTPKWSEEVFLIKKSKNAAP